MASVFRSASVKSNSMWPPFDAFEVAGVPSKRVQHLAHHWWSRGVARRALMSQCGYVKLSSLVTPCFLGAPSLSVGVAAWTRAAE